MNTRSIEEWEDDEEPDFDSRSPLSNELLIEKYRTSQLKVVRTSVDFSTDQLIRMIGDKEVDISPQYQRRNRWDDTKKSKLIESLLLNIPIPPIYLYESDYGQYEVMDGRQRLEALFDFLTDRLQLRGLQFWTEIDGLRYSELPNVLQLGLRRRTIGAIILLAETSHLLGNKNDVRMILFERLNTGGVKLNPQELRNALYQGPFNDLVVDLAGTQEFRDAWEIPSDTDPKISENSMYASMGDCDLVLRFFAVREVIQGLRTGSLRQIMDGCASENRNIPPSKINELRDIFMYSLRVNRDIFGQFCFRLPGTGRLSKSIYDASMVAVSLYPGRTHLQRSTVIENLLQIAPSQQAGGTSPSTPEYAVLVGRGNTTQAIRDRVALLEKVIFGA